MLAYADADYYVSCHSDYAISLRAFFFTHFTDTILILLSLSYVIVDIADTRHALRYFSIALAISLALNIDASICHATSAAAFAGFSRLRAAFFSSSSRR